MNATTLLVSPLQASLRMLGRLLLLAVWASLLSGCLGQGSDKRKLKIVTEPADATVVAGATASFTVAVNGGKTTYQWRRNGTDIVGATAATYTTPATVAADDGALFSVVVSRGSRTLTSRAAKLTVNVPPTISVQPASITVAAGATATFSVTAAGTAPLTYQWRRNGTSITGATAASYTIPATVAGDNGAVFSVVVTNVAGNVTSGNATLTVTTTPVFSGTWGALKSLESSDQRIQEPSVAVNRETGDAVAAWVQSPDGVHAGIYVNLYDYSADTWSGPQLLGSGTLAAGSEFIYSPKAALNSAGDIVVAWMQNTNASSTTGTIRAVRYKPGTGWGEVLTLTRIPGGPEPAITWTYDVDVAMDFAGNATVVWTEEYDSIATVLVASARMPATALADTAQLLESAVTSKKSEAVRVVMDSAGNATALWLRKKPGATGDEVVARRRLATASSWNDEAVLVSLPDAAALDVPAMAIDPTSGDVLAAWRQRPADSTRYDIAYARYVGSLAGWSPTALAESSSLSMGWVSVAVNKLGQGILAWERFLDAGVTEIRAARINMATGALGTEFGLASGSELPYVGIDMAGNVLAQYQTTDGLAWSRRVAADNSLGSPVRLSETSVLTGLGGIGLADSGSAVAVWTQGFNGSSGYTSSNVYAKVYR